MDENFTFWETKAVKLPMGPIVTTVVTPAIGAVILTVLSVIFGAMVPEEKVASSGPTMAELKAAEAVVAAGDQTKLGELIAAQAQKISADADRWTLVSRWQNKTLFELYQTDLLNNVRGQIDSLKKALDAAEKAAKEKAAKGQ
jgi:hypothetical protein